MFNPKRMARVFGRALIVVAPLLLIVMGLGVITELHVHDISWTAFRAAPRRALEFWPAIVRDMVPSLAAMFIAYWLAASFVRALYGLQKLRRGFSFLWRWRFGQMGFGPWLLIQEGCIAKDKDKVLTRMGGPGNLVIYQDSAVVLERAGRITRVERSNFVPLEAFEKVYRAIDLRPKRKIHWAEAMTREGIPITCEADISYQIRGSHREPPQATNENKDEKKKKKQLLFSMVGREVVKAAACTWKCEPLPRIFEYEELNWEELVILAYTDGILRSILARCPLDQLIKPAGWEKDEPHPRQAIREELRQKLREEARKLGVEILSVNLGDIKVENEVTEQWIAAWKAEWDRRMLERRAEGEAEYTAQVETAKAQAQAEMIVDLSRALQSLVADAGALDARLRLLRIIAMLRHASLDPWTQAYLPSGTMRTLTALQDVVAGMGGQ
ncbi:MAG: SPFH domain-containing protein [Ardenticatenia bacterium]|nr:SPFH domain-containing protein [Ardenticatenia bacterium]